MNDSSIPHHYLPSFCSSYLSWFQNSSFNWIKKQLIWRRAQKYWQNVDDSLQVFHLCSCFVWEYFFWMIYLDWWVWSPVVDFANFNYWTHCSLFCILVIQSTFHFLSVLATAQVQHSKRQIGPTTGPGSRPLPTLMARSCKLPPLY